MSQLQLLAGAEHTVLGDGDACRSNGCAPPGPTKPASIGIGVGPLVDQKNEPKKRLGQRGGHKGTPSFLNSGTLRRGSRSLSENRSMILEKPYLVWILRTFVDIVAEELSLFYLVQETPGEFLMEKDGWTEDLYASRMRSFILCRFSRDISILDRLRGEFSFDQG